MYTGVSAMVEGCTPRGRPRGSPWRRARSQQPLLCLALLVLALVLSFLCSVCCTESSVSGAKEAETLMQDARAAFEAAAAALGVRASEPELEFEWHGRRIVALGDLHGDAFYMRLLLHAAGVVDFETGAWIGDDTLLVQTGDVVDRGPEGKEIYEMLEFWAQKAPEQGGRVVRLLGNHDAMNLCSDFRYTHPRENASFGGLAARQRAFSDVGPYGVVLRSLPAAVKINGVVLAHAGVSPRFAAAGLRRTHALLREELKDNCRLLHSKHMAAATSNAEEPILVAAGDDGPLWTRLLTMTPPPVACAALQESLQLLQADVMVVGHTVQESLSIETHCQGGLVGIDTGISRYVGGSPKALEIDQDGLFYEISLSKDNDADAMGLPRAVRRALEVRKPQFYIKEKNAKKETNNSEQGKVQRRQQSQAGGRAAAAEEL